MKILNDFSTSVQKALSEIDPKWRDYEGLIVCGTHTPVNTESLIGELEDAREKGIPTLGICFGMQLMAVEYARHVLGFLDATSEEITDKGTHVVEKLPDLRVGMKPVKGVNESHWHHYGVLKDWAEKLSDFDIVYDDCVEEMALRGHPFYVGTQYHPEYGSSIDKPHPLLVEFIQTCKP